MEITTVGLTCPEGVNIIIGQSHFIKTVEDLYETLAASSPSIKFAVSFCESSGPCLVRDDGNAEELENLTIEYASAIAAGHVFVVFLKDAFQINVLNRIKGLDEVAAIFCATADPVGVVLAETQQERGVKGVVDGLTTKGVEDQRQKEERYQYLRKIGYKK